MKRETGFRARVKGFAMMQERWYILPLSIDQ